MYVRSFSDHRLQYTSKLKIISREYVEYDISVVETEVESKNHLRTVEVGASTTREQRK
jgi:hypothetical protein